MADAIPLTQLAHGILGGKFKLKSGEGLALLSSNALTMAEIAMTLCDLNVTIKLAEMTTAMALLAEDGNPSVIWKHGENAARHWDDKVEVIRNVRRHLNGE